MTHSGNRPPYSFRVLSNGRISILVSLPLFFYTYPPTPNFPTLPGSVGLPKHPPCSFGSYLTPAWALAAVSSSLLRVRQYQQYFYARHVTLFFKIDRRPATRLYAGLLPQTGRCTMPIVKVEPTDEYPVPFRIEPDETKDFMEEITVAANTAELLEELGAPLEVDPSTLEREKALIDAVAKRQQAAPLKNYSTALAASGFLKTYGQNLAFDVHEVRAALTNKLLEIANCGEIKYELKALELLGKHSDISLFTERSEITINYNSPDALEAAIKERIKRLLNAEVIDITPAGMDLDEELGVFQREEEETEETQEEGETDE